MFASIRRYQGHPGRVEETIRLVENGFLPILKKQPGFVAYYAIEAGQNIVVSVSIYKDRASAEAANKAAAAWVTENLSELVDKAGVSVGEVKLVALAPSSQL
jgi:hypothetical protein